MGKSRDLFKKIRDTKGTFHAKMGLIKDRSGMDLTEAEDIKNRWQEYMEELKGGCESWRVIRELAGMEENAEILYSYQI